MHTGRPTQSLRRWGPVFQKSEHGGQTQATSLKALREAGIYLTWLIHSGLIAGNCLQLLPRHGLQYSKEAGGHARNNFPGFSADVGGFASTPWTRTVRSLRGARVGVRPSPEPGAAGLQEAQCSFPLPAPWRLPPQEPRPLGALRHRSSHVGGWPEVVEAVSEAFPVTLGGWSRSGDPSFWRHSGENRASQ